MKNGSIWFDIKRRQKTHNINHKSCFLVFNKVETRRVIFGLTLYLGDTQKSSSGSDQAVDGHKRDGWHQARYFSYLNL